MFDRMRNGFPGLFVSCLTHTVTPYSWRIAYGVTPALTPGPINLSQQVFFNLDGLRSNATNTVLDHKLHLPSAGLRFGFDEFGISTGDLLSNKKGQEYDFWSDSRYIGDGMKQKIGPALGYGETFALSHKEKGDKEESPAVILTSPRSGVTMELYTDQDALHVHTWSEKNGEIFASRQDLTLTVLIGPLKLKHTQGEGDVPEHGAISFEMQDWPDGVNHPEWRNRKTLWGPEDIHTAFSTYKFSVARKES
jgi:aldose 1-epimerase